MLDFTYYRDWDKHLKLYKARQDTIASLLLECASINDLKLDSLLKHVIQTGFYLFDSDDSLYGLFNALRMSHKLISPFIATHDYSVKIIKASLSGKIETTISPIYHLGPDFAEQYKTKTGTALDDKAIIGLITPSTSPNYNARKAYSLGIDAGVAFPQAKISHNKKLTMTIKATKNEELFICLNCESQITSKILAWKDLQLHKLPNFQINQHAASSST